jgi:hypothetical protein
MKSILTGGLMALTITTVGAAEVGQDSANFVLPGCKESVNHGPSRYPDAEFRCGIEVGGLLGTAEYERRSGNRVAPFGSQKPLCADVPRGVTTEQAMRVVISYIEARPQRLHEPFIDLAIEAFRDAWPCPPKGPRP